VKVLVLGASGMLGHTVLQAFSHRFEAYGTVRAREARVRSVAPDARDIFEGVSADDFDGMRRVVTTVRPDAIVNCIGLVKQLDEAKDAVGSIIVNSVLPHRLAALATANEARLVHVSTDCVFSGDRGAYVESDTPDATDLYGRSKLLGEVDAPALTIRTSLVGRELHGGHGLVEWFLGRRHETVRGFRRAVFSGWTTIALARALGDVIEDQPTLSGLWHVAATPITKFDFLTLVRDAFDVDVAIDPDDAFACDRSLDGSAFRAATGLVAPEWPDMVEELARGSAFYDGLREPSRVGR
jgi:dTDP-4-dehydrorhamnose reductase